MANVGILRPANRTLHIQRANRLGRNARQRHPPPPWPRRQPAAPPVQKQNGPFSWLSSSSARQSRNDQRYYKEETVFTRLMLVREKHESQRSAGKPYGSADGLASR